MLSVNAIWLIMFTNFSFAGCELQRNDCERMWRLGYGSQALRFICISFFFFSKLNLICYISLLLFIEVEEKKLDYASSRDEHKSQKQKDNEFKKPKRGGITKLGAKKL